MKKTDSYEKQHRKEKLLIEEKIGLLFDQESFRTLEGGKEEKAGSVVTGYGTIEGRRVYMYAHNSAVKGGTVGLQEGKRIRKLIEEAVRQRRPVVGIQDSGGARIQEGIAALAGYGEVLNAHAAAAGVIPQVMVVAGTCAGGAAYSPGLADFTFMVEETGYMFVTGPDVVEKSCGQKCTWEETGGAGLHGKLSGAAHFCCKNEKECFVRLKRLLIYLSDGMDEKRRRKIVRRRDGDHILPGMKEIVPANGRKGYDICAVIGRIVDRGSFLEIRKDFAESIVTGFGRMGGWMTGIVANQPMRTAGAIDCNAAVKGAAFVRFCNAYHIPVITFMDTPGFLPGAGQEQEGMVRHGAKLLFAYAEADTVKLTVILRKAYGGAYICMGSKALGMDAVYAWPGAEIAVMGAECAIPILHKRKLAGMDEEEKQEFIKKRTEEYQENLKADVENAMRYGYIDGWLEPDHTREQLIRDLEYYGKRRKTGKRKRKYGLVPL